MSAESATARRLAVLEAAPAPSPMLEGADLSTLGPTLVLGATSQIGLFAVRRLLDAGLPVIAHFRRRELPFSHPRLLWIRRDLEQGPPVGMPPLQTVIATTALWLLPGALSALRDSGAERVVAFGSSSVIAKRGSADAAERRTVARLEETEAAFWQQTARLGMAATLFRPTLIYGAGLDHNVEQIRRVIRRLNLFPIYKGAPGLRQPVHADDLAIAALLAATTPATAGRTYFLPGGETLPYRAMVERVFKAEDIPPMLLNWPVWPAVMRVLALFGQRRFNAEMFRRMKEDLTFDGAPAARDFGFFPRPFTP